MKTTLPNGALDANGRVATPVSWPVPRRAPGGPLARGYPRSMFVDYSRQVADEELSLQISDVAVAAS